MAAWRTNQYLLQAKRLIELAALEADQIQPALQQSIALAIELAITGALAEAISQQHLGLDLQPPLMNMLATLAQEYDYLPEFQRLQQLLADNNSWLNQVFQVQLQYQQLTLVAKTNLIGSDLSPTVDLSACLAQAQTLIDDFRQTSLSW